MGIARLNSKFIILEAPAPLLVTPQGVRELSQAEFNEIKAAAPQQKGLQDSELLEAVLKSKLAYEAAKNHASNPSLTQYHMNEIHEGHQQFEEVETTMSHMYRWPNGILRNMSYGAALCEKFLSQLKYDSEILEIGCGTGYLARNFLDALKKLAPEKYQGLRYNMFDLSPALTKTQKDICHEHLEKIEFIQGDIQEYQFSKRFDLILANEMIADLEVTVVDKAQGPGAELIKKYSLNTTSAPPLYLINSGAIALIEKLPLLLAPGGVAYVTEFGELDEYPVSVRLGGHAEHSIRFCDLIKVAHYHGLHTNFFSVGEFLQFKEEWEVLSRDSYALLSDILLPYLGRKRLERRPYDRKSLEVELGDLEIFNLQFNQLKERKDLLSPFLFKALIIKNCK